MVENFIWIFIQLFLCIIEYLFQIIAVLGFIWLSAGVLYHVQDLVDLEFDCSLMLISI